MVQKGIKTFWRHYVLNIKWYIPIIKPTRCTNFSTLFFVLFYSENKFEKLVHLVGFIIKIYHDARSPERQIKWYIEVFVHFDGCSFIEL